MENNNSRPNRVFRHSRALALATIGVVGFLLYSNSLSGEFCFDDRLFILKSSAVRSSSFDFPALWQEFHARFLVGFSYALNYRLGGENVLGYHLLNLLVHVFTAILVYCFIFLSYETPVLRKNRPSGSGQRIAFWAAMVFLCHPVQTQAVAYITQRASSMAALFYIATLVLYILYRLKRRRLFLPALAGTAVLGLLSKQVMITIPLTIFVYDVFFLREHKARPVRLIKAFCLSLGVLFLLVMFTRMEPPESSYQYQGLVSWARYDVKYVWTEMNVLRTYLRLFVLPVSQNLDYDYPIATGFFEPATFSSFLLLSALVVMAFRFFKTAREVSFCVYWFFVTTSIEALSVIFGNRGVIYEHWLYLPMAGFSWFLSYALYAGVNNPLLYRRIMLAIILVLSVLTFHRNRVWEKEIYLWQDVLKKSPSNPGGYFAMGELCHRRGNTAAAEEYYRKAVALYHANKQPFDPTAKVQLSRIYNNLGLLYQERSDPEPAAVFFTKAININPNHASPYHNLAILFYEYGQYQKAVDLLERSSRLQGPNEYAYLYLGLSYRALGETEKARAYLKDALQLFSEAGVRTKVEEIQKQLESL